MYELSRFNLPSEFENYILADSSTCSRNINMLSNDSLIFMKASRLLKFITQEKSLKVPYALGALFTEEEKFHLLKFSILERMNSQNLKRYSLYYYSENIGYARLYHFDENELNKQMNQIKGNKKVIWVSFKPLSGLKAKKTFRSVLSYNTCYVYELF